jgi:hypothetical protein
MTTLVVGDGQYKTIGAAIAAASAGDIVIVRPGTYRENLTIGKAITLQGEPGAVIDGGWDGEAVVAGTPVQLSIKATGATVRGLAVRNCGGKGISITVSGVTVDDCHVFNCRRDGIVVHGGDDGIENVVVKGCSFMRLNMAMATNKADQAVGAGCVFVNVADSQFIGNRTDYVFKETLIIDRNTIRLRVEGNVFGNGNHATIYFNHSQDNFVTGNVLYADGLPEFEGRNGLPAAVVFGDETAIPSRFGPQRGNTFTGNIIVNTGRFIEVRNGTNYETTLVDTVIANNTCVAGPNTHRGIAVAAPAGGAHKNSIFCNNVIEFTHAKADAVIGRDGAGLDFTRNAWTSKPPPAMQSILDVYGDLKLVDAGAGIKGGVIVDNYRPATGSPLILADDKVLGALMPITPPPPDPTPTMDELVTALEGHRKTLAGAGLAVTDALNEVDELIALLKSE